MYLEDYGPRKEISNGWEFYYLHGKLHREGGPACYCLDGNGLEVYYYRHGKRHREDGPAATWAPGHQSYYLDGKFLSFEEWKEKLCK